MGALVTVKCFICKKDMPLQKVMRLKKDDEVVTVCTHHHGVDKLERV